jgi:hypothetical protein
MVPGTPAAKKPNKFWVEILFSSSLYALAVDFFLEFCRFTGIRRQKFLYTFALAGSMIKTFGSAGKEVH